MENLQNKSPYETEERRSTTQIEHEYRFSIDCIDFENQSDEIEKVLFETTPKKKVYLKEDENAQKLKVDSKAKTFKKTPHLLKTQNQIKSSLSETKNIKIGLAYDEFNKEEFIETIESLKKEIENSKLEFRKHELQIRNELTSSWSKRVQESENYYEQKIKDHEIQMKEMVFNRTKILEQIITVKAEEKLENLRKEKEEELEILRQQLVTNSLEIRKLTDEIINLTKEIEYLKQESVDSTILFSNGNKKSIIKCETLSQSQFPCELKLDADEDETEFQNEKMNETSHLPLMLNFSDYETFKKKLNDTIQFNTDASSQTDFNTDASSQTDFNTDASSQTDLQEENKVKINSEEELELINKLKFKSALNELMHIRLKNKGKEIDRLNSEIKKFKENLGNKNNLIKKLKNKLEKAKFDLNLSSIRLEEKEVLIKKLKTELDKTKQDLDKSQKSIILLEKEKESMSIDHSELILKGKDYQERIKLKDNQNELLENNLHNIKNKLEDLENENKLLKSITESKLHKEVSQSSLNACQSRCEKDLTDQTSKSYKKKSLIVRLEPMSEEKLNELKNSKISEPNHLTLDKYLKPRKKSEYKENDLEEIKVSKVSKTKLKYLSETTEYFSADESVEEPRTLTTKTSQEIKKINLNKPAENVSKSPILHSFKNTIKSNKEDIKPSKKSKSNIMNDCTNETQNLNIINDDTVLIERKPSKLNHSDKNSF